MPGTWTILAAISATTDSSQFFYLAVVGAIGATIGRIILAKISRNLVRTKFLSDKTRLNIDAVKNIIEKRKGLTIAAFFLYAFGPLPTNYIFISYGLTSLPLRYLVIPFFFGRVVSYSLFTFTGEWLGNIYSDGNLFTSYGLYFVITQILTILAVYWFTKINWQKIGDKID